MPGKNAATLLNDFFRAERKSSFDPRSILLAVIEVQEHVEVWDSAGVDVEPFADALPIWRAEIYHYLHPETGGFANYAGSGKLSKSDIGLLGWVAERLSTVSPESTEESRESIREMVQAARSLLIEDDTIPEKLRLHVTRLLRHVEEALDNFEITGDFLLEDAVERLIGALQFVETSSSKASKWSDFRSQFIPGLAAQLSASGALEGIALVAANVTKALGG
ncbi:hypothetical protein [Microbacterium sp. 22296]|uniref:hypothetical protein n=1 Tax=Microbacterium sp. 22296 TaxID=3453903 RepID=UPI003F852F89